VGPDHARRDVHAADLAQADGGRGFRRSFQVDPDRLFLQALRRQQSERDDVLYGLPAVRDVAYAGPLAARGVVQLPDLRRLLRLLLDRARPGTAFRLSSAGQFQPALHLRLVLGILDALAYFAVDLAQDLSLHPARRQ